MGVLVTELVRYLQKMFFLLSCELVFSYNKACFQERTNPCNCLFQRFLDENFNFSGLEDLRRSKENISADLPLPSLPMAIDLQTFSGFWPFAPLGRRVWMLGQAEERKAVGAGSRTRCCGCEGSRVLARRSFAVRYLRCLLVPERGSGMWQPPQRLTAEKSLAKAPSRSRFVCTAKPFLLVLSSVVRSLSLRCDELCASRGCLVLG